MNPLLKRLKNGIIEENPVFVQVLGMCPTLAVTTSAENGMGMGLATMAVLIMSNLFISLFRKIIPTKVRIPAFIVIIATFVTLVDLLLQGFVPALYKSLGLFIPLIVVNCVILGRAEAYASKNSVWKSVFDGIGMGLGFTFALTVIGIVRELLGSGSIFGIKLIPMLFEQVPLLKMIFGEYQPISIIVLAPGAFLVLGGLLALFNYVREKLSTASAE